MVPLFKPFAALESPATTATVPVVVINCDSQTKRWAAIQQRLGGFSNIRRSPGVDVTTDIPVPVLDERIELNTRIDLARHRPRWRNCELGRLAAVGASLAHIKVWEMIVEQGWPLTLVMEDGAVFDASLPQQISSLYQRSHGASTLFDGDVWVLSGFKSMLKMRPYPYSGGWRQIESYAGNQGYLISRGAAAALLRTAFPISTHIEFYMSNVAATGAVTLWRHPQGDLVWRGGAASTIGHIPPLGMSLVLVVILLLASLLVAAIAGVVNAATMPASCPKGSRVDRVGAPAAAPGTAAQTERGLPAARRPHRGEQEGTRSPA